MAGAPRQKKRASRTSKGTGARGSKRVRLTGIQKILLGGGLHANIHKLKYQK